MIYYYLQKITSLLENSGPQATCSSGIIFSYTIKLALLPVIYQEWGGQADCEFWVGVCHWETLVPDTVNDTLL